MEDEPDPVFGTCDVRDQILAAGLDLPAWKVLLADPGINKSGLLSAGIAWALVWRFNLWAESNL